MSCKPFDHAPAKVVWSRVNHNDPKALSFVGGFEDLLDSL